MFASSLRHSDRKAAQILGVDLTRNNATNPADMRTRIIHVLKKALRRRNTPSDEPGFRWDIPNPFATPDLAIARVQALLRAEIARTESIAPHERDPLLDDIVEDHEDVDFFNDTASVDSDGWHEDRADADADSEDEYEDDMNIEDEDYTDMEDEDYTDMEDEDYTGIEDEISPAPIALPRLLPIPLRFIPSPTPSSPTDSDEEEKNKDTPAPWADLAQVYNSIAEGEELARKARRDLYRSRQKLLALLGPEVSSAL